MECLLKQENYSLITSICQKALGIEPFDEDIHYNLVYSLLKDGHTAQAAEEYQRTMDLFYNEFSILPSDRFKDLYKTIRSKEQGINTSLDAIQRTLREENAEGAFYCEYPVFCDVFQLERRAISRSEGSIFLCLLTLVSSQHKTLFPDVLSEAMDRLRQAIWNSLRCSDIFTRYSISQYLILLPIDSYENGEAVLQRIVSKFKDLYVCEELKAEYSLQPVKPYEEVLEEVLENVF